MVGRFALPVIRVMLEKCELYDVLALPEKSNIAEFQRVAESNLQEDDGKLGIQPCTALSALLSSIEEVDKFHRRVKMSNAERFLCDFITTMREEARTKAVEGDEEEALKLYKFYVLDKVYQRGGESALTP